MILYDVTPKKSPVVVLGYVTFRKLHYYDLFVRTASMTGMKFVMEAAPLAIKLKSNFLCFFSRRLMTRGVQISLFAVFIIVTLTEMVAVLCYCGYHWCLGENCCGF